MRAKMSLLWLTMTIFTAVCAIAGTVTHTYTFDRPVITTEDGIAEIYLEGAPAWGDVGEPLLPAQPLMLLLPPGEEAVSITIEVPDPIPLGEGFRLAEAQQPQPISRLGEVPSNGAYNSVMKGKDLYPENLYRNLRTHFLSGHGIASALIFPVRYRPSEGELSYYPELRVTVQTKPTTRASQVYNEMLKRTPTVRERVARTVQNPELSSLYPKASPKDTETWDYLIITTDAFVDLYQDFTDFKNASGYATAVETVEDIYANYNGLDDQDKIRNCIIDYYQNYDISYVLLAGDDEQIPCRKFYVSAGGYEAYIPSDLYYAGLDGNWNTDGDAYWGEFEEADFLAEVFVGRSCADNAVEVVNVVNKTLLFESSPVADEITTGLMLGEDMGWTSWGWEYKEEIRLGSSNYGYTTVGFPANFTVDTLYENQSTTWSAMSDLLPLLNQGPQLVNHMGHANWNYVLKFNLDEINDNNFTNNGVNHNFFIGYSQGCIAGNFEHSGEDCILEAFTTIASGAVAFVGNSRYGWGVSSGTNGPSQRFDREFFDAIFGESITRIGWTNQDSKEDNVAWAADDYIRWCYYELNLFGDPTLDIWTSQPGVYDPVYEETVLTGVDTFVVSNIGVIGSVVTVSQNGVMLGQGESNFTSSAVVYFDEPLQATGTLDLMITDHDMIPYTGSIEAVQPSIALTPYGSPIVIPGSGGQFDFNIEVNNPSSQDITADIWCEVTLPDSSIYGPVLGPVQDFNLPGNWSTSRDRTQNVPASAPGGTYTYNAYIGVYPDIISAQDSFTFVKEGGDGISGGFAGWFNRGEDFESRGDDAPASAPVRFTVYPPHPNPFNPVTVFTYELAADGDVSLTVYDVTGKRVGQLINRRQNAGKHFVSFDGSGLPSGLYFYLLAAGGEFKSGKMILLK